MITEIGQDEFNKAKESEKLGFVKVSAPWCAACKAIHPAIVMVSEDNPDVDFYQIDADQNPELVEELGIRSLPSYVILKGGQAAVHKNLVSIGQIKRLIADNK